MLTPALLIIMVVALSISMLILSYKKIIPLVSMDLFVDLKNDITRESGISFPKNRLELPWFTKLIVARNRYESGYDGGVSNNLYAMSARARSPTLNEISSLCRC